MLGLLMLALLVAALTGVLTGVIVLLTRFDSWRMCRGLRIMTEALKDRIETPLPTPSGMMTLDWIRIEGRLHGCRISVTPKAEYSANKMQRWIHVEVEPIATSRLRQADRATFKIPPALYGFSARKSALQLASYACTFSLQA